MKKENLCLPTSFFRKQRTRKLEILSASLVICEIINILGFLEFNVDTIILLGLMTLSFVIFGLFKSLTANKLYLIYFVYLLINIILTHPPIVFKSWLRLGLFIGLLLCVAPVFQNNDMRIFRIQCFNYLIIFCIPLSVISFFCYFLGINFAQYTFSRDISIAGAFSGLFKNSMLLGPISAISACYCFWSLLNTKNKYWVFLFIPCIGACLFSASRSAVYGCMLGCISMLLYSGKTTKIIKQLLILSIITCITFPLWEGALSGINQKNSANESLGQYGSRTEKFEARIEEFESSPLLGIGFASINPNGRDTYDATTGVVEPGSSWLGVLSMTGIIGFIFVITMYINAFTSIRKCKSTNANLFLGLMIFLTFHEIFEGYLLAAGSTLCFISWLILGITTDLKYFNK